VEWEGFWGPGSKNAMAEEACNFWPRISYRVKPAAVSGGGRLSCSTAVLREKKGEKMKVGERKNNLHGQRTVLVP